MDVHFKESHCLLRFICHEKYCHDYNCHNLIQLESNVGYFMDMWEPNDIHQLILMVTNVYVIGSGHQSLYVEDTEEH